MKKNFIFLSICIIINAFFSNQENQSFEVTIDNKAGFYINDDSIVHFCDKWYPSLFIPLLFIPTMDINVGTEVDGLKFELSFPFINNNEEFEVNIFENVSFLNKDYSAALIRPVSLDQIPCYFGISPGIDNNNNLKKEYHSLEILKNNSNIKEKIFSFDKWDLNASPPKSKFYLGEYNDIFNSNEGIIGTCKSYQNGSLWGCPFKEMIFNKNINIPLKYDNGSLYKVYLASEIHNLYFPNDFKNIFNKYSNNTCSCTKTNYLNCTNFFNNSEFVPLQLTEENEQFIITGQVDKYNRFNKDDPSKKDLAKITFGNINYIILPLSVFKEFNIKFDANKRFINFHTNDSKILKVKEKEKEKSKSSSAGIVFLIILIILIVLVLGYLVYRFVFKNRKTESSINKFSKFEDEEDYQNINGKKVF